MCVCVCTRVLYVLMRICVKPFFPTTTFSNIRRSKCLRLFSLYRPTRKFGYKIYIYALNYKIQHSDINHSVGSVPLLPSYTCLLLLMRFVRYILLFVCMCVCDKFCCGAKVIYMYLLMY